MLSAIMHETLGCVGVMAMECFIAPSGLLINELAPRVHNSGNWTQTARPSASSELHHLPHPADLPLLPSWWLNSPSVMIP